MIISNFKVARMALARLQTVSAPTAYDPEAIYKKNIKELKQTLENECKKFLTILKPAFTVKGNLKIQSDSDAGNSYFFIHKKIIVNSLDKDVLYPLFKKAGYTYTGKDLDKTTTVCVGVNKTSNMRVALDKDGFLYMHYLKH